MNAAESLPIKAKIDTYHPIASRYMITLPIPA